MHWIRRMRQEKGWSQKELAKKAGCTVGLIDMLEEADGTVTHWAIANEIAGALGAGKAERDSIVPRERRDEAFVYPPREAEMLEKQQRRDRRGIVVIDRNGQEVDRLETVWATARKYDCSTKEIYQRCAPSTRPKNEFRRRDVSFRWARNWNDLNGGNKDEQQR